MDLIIESKLCTALTGAGVSTESGIPDYRSPNGAYSLGHKPMTHQTFTSSHSNRQRYWTRSFLGWGRFSSREPNDAHLALARLQKNGWIHHIITQNVDRLHHKAAASVHHRKQHEHHGHSIIELHGTTHEVVCLDCGHKSCRREMQNQLALLNPGLEQHARASEAESGQTLQRPDGDVDDEDFSSTIIPSCSSCKGGSLKPDVVFFGDNLPRDRSEKTLDLAQSSDLLLVVGTSLSTRSSLRIAEEAKKRGSKLVVVNIGPLARGSDLFDVKVESRASELLMQLATSPRLLLPRITL